MGTGGDELVWMGWGGCADVPHRVPEDAGRGAELGAHGRVRHGGPGLHVGAHAQAHEES